MSQTSVRAFPITTTDTLFAATAYWGGTLRSGAAASAVQIRRGAVGGAIIDTFNPAAAATSESHPLSAPVGCPEGIFADVDANSASLVVWGE